jgi:hypothetical protein
VSAFHAACAHVLTRLFSLALGLYPAEDRREYAGEMQVVFALKARDAAQKSAWALLRLALREARDLPVAAGLAHFRNWRGDMNRYFPTTTDRVPWTTALLSLIPLFIAGPVRVIVFFTPEFSPVGRSPLYLAFLGLSALLLLAGVVVGAVKKSPRWSYPYGLSLAFLLSILVQYLSYLNGWKPADGFGIALLVLVPILAFLWLPPFRTFYANIRQDWTLLSYALYGLVLYLLAGIDSDETPTLNLLVLLPSLLSLCGALAYLRVGQGMGRIAALLAATFIGMFFFWLPVFQGMVSMWASVGMGLFLLLGSWVILGGILLSPLLVIILRSSLSKAAPREG